MMYEQKYIWSNRYNKSGQGPNGIRFQKILNFSIFWPKAKIYDQC